jgi:hypothetical protein
MEKIGVYIWGTREGYKPKKPLYPESADAESSRQFDQIINHFDQRKERLFESLIDISTNPYFYYISIEADYRLFSMVVYHKDFTGHRDTFLVFTIACPLGTILQGDVIGALNGLKKVYKTFNKDPREVLNRFSDSDINDQLRTLSIGVGNTRYDFSNMAFQFKDDHELSREFGTFGRSNVYFFHETVDSKKINILGITEVKSISEIQNFNSKGEGQAKIVHDVTTGKAIEPISSETRLKELRSLIDNAEKECWALDPHQLSNYDDVIGSLDNNERRKIQIWQKEYDSLYAQGLERDIEEIYNEIVKSSRSVRLRHEDRWKQDIKLLKSKVEGCNPSYRADFNGHKSYQYLVMHEWVPKSLKPIFFMVGGGLLIALVFILLQNYLTTDSDGDGISDWKDQEKNTLQLAYKKINPRDYVDSTGVLNAEKTLRWCKECDFIDTLDRKKFGCDNKTSLRPFNGKLLKWGPKKFVDCNGMDYKPSSASESDSLYKLFGLDRSLDSLLITFQDVNYRLAPTFKTTALWTFTGEEERYYRFAGNNMLQWKNEISEWSILEPAEFKKLIASLEGGHAAVRVSSPSADVSNNEGTDVKGSGNGGSTSVSVSGNGGGSGGGSGGDEKIDSCLNKCAVLDAIKPITNENEFTSATNALTNASDCTCASKSKVEQLKAQYRRINPLKKK